jgi:hypothetical protein
MSSRTGKFILLLGVLAGMTGSRAFACATCYGASDSPMAQGMNWGILVLLGFIGTVLTGVVAFFVHVGRNSAKMSAPGSKPIQTDKLTR